LNSLVNGAADFVAAEGRDHSFDLAPVAEAGDIAVVAATLRARRGLEAGVVSETLDQVGRIGQGRASVDEGTVHTRGLKPIAVSGLPTNVVNGSLTMLLPASIGACMPSSTRAGGCFLTLFILAGLPLGLAIGNPMKGILIGTGIGIALAVITWLVDLRRP
jgi:hypothetical protein